MFQPGEEVEGGAELMIAEGLLDAAGRRVDAAYALHVYSVVLPERACGSHGRARCTPPPTPSWRE